MCLHETQLYQLSHISDGCSLCALDGTRTEEPKSKCHWVLVPIQHNTITGFSGVNSHSAGEWRPKDGCGTHCLPRTSCELDSPQPSPYTLAFLGHSYRGILLPSLLHRKIRHRDVKELG